MRRVPLFLVVVTLIALGVVGFRVWTLTAPVPIKELLQPDPAGAVTFTDASGVWDWQAACAAPLDKLLQLSQPLSVSLVDDATDLAVGVAYPHADHPTAVALAGCSEGDGRLECRVAVNQGEAGPDLDTAVTVAMAYGVQEALRPRSRQEWEARSPWNWADYAPLIRKEENAWRSRCLTLWRP